MLDTKLVDAAHARDRLPWLIQEMCTRIEESGLDDSWPDIDGLLANSILAAAVLGFEFPPAERLLFSREDDESNASRGGSSATPLLSRIRFGLKSVDQYAAKIKELRDDSAWSGRKGRLALRDKLQRVDTLHAQERQVLLRLLTEPAPFLLASVIRLRDRKTVFVTGYRLHNPDGDGVGREIVTSRTIENDGAKGPKWIEAPHGDGYAAGRRAFVAVLRRWKRWVDSLPVASSTAPGSSRAPGPSLDPNGGPQESDSAGRARSREKSRIGRPKQYDSKADRKVWDAWKSGEHRNLEELARALGKTRKEIDLAIDRVRHRARQRGKSRPE